MSLDVRIAAGKPPIVPVTGVPDLESWMARHRANLHGAVAEHGAVLVRGLALSTPDEVGRAVRQLTDRLMADREAFLVRQRFPGGLYSSAEWPATDQMCMHHELSYGVEFPSRLLLACLTAPAAGGVTGLADAAAVLADLPAHLVQRFEEHGWQLVRCYADQLGVPWPDAFGTQDPGAVADYCRSHAIDHEWLPDGTLRTRQRRPAVTRHPVTGRRCWFNGIAFMNEWTLDAEVRDYLRIVCGPESLPCNTSYGDGTPIEKDVIRQINEVYEAHTVREPWQAGDLLLIDNIRMAHSREPYQPPREVVVAMADPVRHADVTVGTVRG